MKNNRNFVLTFILVISGAFIAVLVYASFFQKPKVITITEKQPVQYASLPQGVTSLPDLTYAAEKTIHAVVHIKTQSERGGGWSTGNPLLEFFGYRYRQEPQIAQGFGSGVIISSDGYIVTNNHVIEDAQKIKVVLNDKREFDAKLVGTDPTTDVALLKIDARDLVFLSYGNSDNLKLGEWVLAVGNPFNLTSTVTAGIVSAKARNIGINDNNLSIESFIQTDAAVNPGNSGGALVNQLGELVGVNTAIASQTGTYAGYSFAIPATIVKKVVGDLKEYGEVQRALLGVEISNVDAKLMEDKNLDKIEGVFVGGVTENGAAREAGIKEGDIILSINGKDVNSTAELMELVGQLRPGDKAIVDVKRNSAKKQFSVILRNRHGDTKIVKGEENTGTYLGAEFEPVTDKDKENLEIGYGIKITSIGNGKLKQAGVKEGFVITDVNKRPIYTLNDFRKVISNAGRGRGILVEGVTASGQPAYFVFGVD